MEAAKRECILVEAGRAFARFGFQKASVDEIARNAGVAKGTIYLASPSKKDLFYDVLLREIRAWNAELMKRIDPRTPADETLMKLAWDTLSTMDSRPLVRDLMTGAHHELLPDLAPRFDELRQIGMQPITEVLRQGIRQGRFRAAIDVDQVASVLLDLHITTLIFHVKDHVRDGRGDDLPARLQARGAAIFDLILRGLLQDPSTPTPA